MKTLPPIDSESRMPKHLQARRILVEAIRKGKFPPGGRLPDSREIAVQMNASLVTTRRTLWQLVKDGWLGRAGSEFTVAWPGLDSCTGYAAASRKTAARNRVPVLAKSA